ncbi:MAG: PIN domain-containing protein [Lachnospiraceae bacterium]|nr:PIN domain-containing protein [Lachnospiraceae bacterium]
MTDSKIFLDTSPLIYFLEKSESFYGIMAQFFTEHSNAEFVTSVATIAEYFPLPYRNDDLALIDAFNHFITTMCINVMSIDRPIAEKAARIRAEYLSFKGMDSLQLATAVIAGCDLFLTNDKQLRQFSEISCVTVDDISSQHI